MPYPHDHESLAVWTLAITIAYFVVAIFILTFRRRTRDFTYWMKSIFDGVLFAGSVVLLWGVFDRNILVYFSELTTFLIISGLAGSAWGLFSLFSSD